MKMVKSLLLGSAAGIAAIAGAQAADLPVKAKPVEYVKVCSLYGAGYYYIPGTETCIRIGGFLRMNVGLNNGVYSPILSGPNGARQRDRAFVTNTTRAASQIDIRSNTDYGVLRTYVYTYLQAGSNAATAPTVLTAYSQLAGFTVGKFKSSYNAPWSVGGSGNLGIYRPDDASSTAGIEYKWDLGGGLSTSIGVFDPRRTGVYDRQDTQLIIGAFPNSAPALGVVNSGYHMPDIQANVRIEQAWGGFHVGAKVQEVSVVYNGTNASTVGAGAGGILALETTGAPKTKYGYAVNATTNIKNLPTGTGDQLWATVAYAKGSMNSLFSSTPSTSISLFGPGRGGAYNTVAFGYLLDGVFDSLGGFGNGQIQLTEAWSATLLYEHWWLPAKLKSGFYGNYASVNYNAAAKASICTQGSMPGSTTPAGASRFFFTPGSVCDPNWSWVTLGSNSTWYPARDFEITVDVAWSRFDTASSGTMNHVGPLLASGNTLPAGKPAGLYEIQDQSVVYGTVNFLRTW